ncbi:glycoside hydrolase family 3 N-terminal domain-containing protein [Crossiella sp. CA-258035]|uniref:glycoside hydrolase family 3 N-terminal domain-containing protein n=1 Tax=Crossiella sp. CA-258035 TaxID=2981138 RepID=UPI0024BC9529|nr:glycoside hydrolase family 3 N-terminal domain-containing protein [Crossiella sp. CA-258035]WHT20857.1 glycoside hydrolase family 3 N-terminal domain-containing protein [Crossiella sp. CA-258035]
MLRTRPTLALTAVAALMLGSAHASTAQEPGADRGPAVYLDAAAPVERRVSDLLRRMTLEEKAGQMAQIRVGKLRGNCDYGPGPLVESCMKAVLGDAKVGSILSGGGDNPAPDPGPKAWAEMTNAIQKFALENQRLRIPVIYGADGVHGHSNLPAAVMFPHQIGLGATWNPELIRQAGKVTGEAMRATGVFWNFAPVSDLARDTRWGRYYETYSEDPFLAGSLAAAAVKGMQTPASDTAQLTATAKHFAGYSQPFNGHDRANAFIPVRQLQDSVLPPFQAQFDAGVKTVMINSGAINGIPVHASRYMLVEQLRERMGFQGVAVSDWEDMKKLVTDHKVAADYPSAIAMSVNAGVDMAMEPSDAQAFTQGLVTVVRDGRVSQRRIDEAVRRILKLKFELGLFEKPFVDPAKAEQAVRGNGAELSRKAATESMVLLRNEKSTLPLSSSAKKLVITGDTADDARRQLGGWTVEWQGVPPNGPFPETTTVLEGLKAAAPQTEISHAQDQATAVAEAKTADAVVVVLGEKEGAEGTADTEDPSLRPAQQQLVDAVQATGKPVVVVLLTGRGRVLGSVADADALLSGWLPGTEGGHAVADVLFGKANPSGKLPVSWPKTVGDQPMSYDQLPGANAGVSSKYDPAYPFGFGLSYTSFEMGAPAAPGIVKARDNVKVSVTVRNTGSRAGTEIVPVYVQQPVSAVQVPERRLVGFTKVTLNPGEQKSAEVTFDTDQLALTAGDVDGAGRREVPKGSYLVEVGGKTTPLTLR